MASILLVEDEVFVREFARLVVGDLGHSMLLASDLDQALGFLRSPALIDLLFTDIRLKTARLGGYDLAREGVSLRPQLRVLYASGDSETDGTKSLSVEGARFVEKPYSQEQLQVAIEGLLATPNALARSIPSP
jgi:CheY-like chemotaxis protein